MKKVILVSNKLYKYRAQVYSEFINLFKEQDIDFKVVVSTACKEENFGMPEDKITFVGSSFHKLNKYLNYEKPDVIINFLHPTNRSIWFLYFYTWVHKIPNIYWNHGINLQDPHNKLKLVIYSFFHKVSSAILLYTKNELKYIKKKYHSKTFYANNTINFKMIPDVSESVSSIKSQYNLNFEKYVLFVGRVQQRKKLDILIEIFKSEEFQEYGLIIVGPGFSEENSTQIRTSNNITYLGAIYDDLEVNKIFKASDVFCIPGTNGLGINQAMFWGLPCLALNVRHSPEIIYLENEKNGFICNTNEDLKDKLLLILQNKKLYSEFSQRAKEIIKEKADISIMFRAFLEAVNFVMESK